MIDFDDHGTSATVHLMAQASLTRSSCDPHKLWVSQVVNFDAVGGARF